MERSNEVIEVLKRILDKLDEISRKLDALRQETPQPAGDIKEMDFKAWLLRLVSRKLGDETAKNVEVLDAGDHYDIYVLEENDDLLGLVRWAVRKAGGKEVSKGSFSAPKKVRFRGGRIVK